MERGSDGSFHRPVPFDNRPLKPQARCGPAMRAKGVDVRKIAAEVGLGVGTVLRLVAA
jgi:hypothetical protein